MANHPSRVTSLHWRGLPVTPKSNQLLQAVKEILFLEWDPIGVNDCDDCRNEYDSYAVSIHELLRSGADEFKLTASLGRYQRESMGLTRIDIECDRRVAQHLLALVTNNEHH